MYFTRLGTYSMGPTLTMRVDSKTRPARSVRTCLPSVMLLQLASTCTSLTGVRLPCQA